MTIYRFTVTFDSELPEAILRRQLERHLAGLPCTVKRYHTPRLTDHATALIREKDATINRMRKQLEGLSR